MQRLLNPWLHLVLTISLLTAAEMFLKIGASAAAAPHALGFSSLGSREVWIGTSLLVLSFPTWMLTLRAMPLYLAFLLCSVIHVTIPLSAWLCLGESIGALRWAGIALVCAGIVVIARPASRIEDPR